MLNTKSRELAIRALEEAGATDQDAERMGTRLSLMKRFLDDLRNNRGTPSTGWGAK